MFDFDDVVEIGIYRSRLMIPTLDREPTGFIVPFYHVGIGSSIGWYFIIRNLVEGNLELCFGAGRPGRHHAGEQITVFTS